jgi:hypothetical protein
MMSVQSLITLVGSPVNGVRRLIPSLYDYRHQPPNNRSPRPLPISARTEDSRTATAICPRRSHQVGDMATSLADRSKCQSQGPGGQNAKSQHHRGSRIVHSSSEARARPLRQIDWMATTSPPGPPINDRRPIRSEAFTHQPMLKSDVTAAEQLWLRQKPEVNGRTLETSKVREDEIYLTWKFQIMTRVYAASVRRSESKRIRTLPLGTARTMPTQIRTSSTGRGQMPIGPLRVIRINANETLSL